MPEKTITLTEDEVRDIMTWWGASPDDFVGENTAIKLERFLTECEAK